MKRNCILTSLVFILLSVVSVFAVPDDDYGEAKKIEGTHFSIYYKPQSDLSDLTQQLNVSSSDRLLAGGSFTAVNSTDMDLAQRIDALFMLVCDILDMQLYSYKGTIKICLDEDQLSSIYRK